MNAFKLETVSLPPDAALPPNPLQGEAAPGLTASVTSRNCASRDAECGQVHRAQSSVAPTAVLKPKYDVRLIGQREIGDGVNFYSLDREMALGRDLSKEVEAACEARH